MIRDSSLTLSGLLSSDELNDDCACLHELVGFLVCLFSCCFLYFVYDLILNNNNDTIVCMYVCMLLICT